MEKLQALRMTYLAWFLGEVLPEEFFDITSYVEHRPGYNLPYEVEQARLKNLIEAKPRCGTTACAIGWCPTIFPKDWMYDMVSTNPVLISNSSLISDFGYSIGEGREAYFGISSFVNDALFYGNARTAKQEAEMIKKVMLNYGWVYDTCLEEAKAMFGADLAERFQPICPTGDC